MNLPSKVVDELINIAEEALNLPRSAKSILKLLFDEGEATIVKIVRSTRISRKTVHEHLKRMRRIGLVVRRPSEVGGRLLYVYSTPPATAVIGLLKRVLLERLRTLEEIERVLGGVEGG